MESEKEQMMVSVCVQTYQHEAYIGECIEGILKQKTDFPIEIIIGEDASSDGTREVCQSYAAQHPDLIRLFLRKREDVIHIAGRPTGRYNFMENLKAAKGKYIAICEGDDFWTDPEKLQKQVDYMESNPQCSYCYHHWRSYDQTEGKIVGKLFKSDRTLTVLFRNNFGKLPDQFREVYNSDNFLKFILSTKGYTHFIDGVKPAIYRMHSGGMWSKVDSEFKLKNRLETWLKIKEVYQGSEHQVKADSEIIKTIVDIDAHQKKTGKQILDKSVRSTIADLGLFNAYLRYRFKLYRTKLFPKSRNK